MAILRGGRMVSLSFPFRLISKDNEKIMNRQGRYFVSKKYREFDKMVKLFAKQQYKGEPLDGNLKVTIVAEFDSKVHCDLFNLPKGLMDSLQGIVMNNDKQIKVGRLALAETMAKDKFSVDIEPVE